MSRRAPLWVDALLRLHPAEYRSRYGDAVREVLAARAASLRGVSARMRFAAREGAGLAASAVREWLRVVSAVRMGGGGREMRHALRRLARAPGFSVAAIGMLALGVGSTMAVYTLLHRVVLRPLPYAASERLVWLDHRAPGMDLDFGIGSAAWLYAHYEASSRLLEGVVQAQPSALTIVDAGAPAERVPMAWTTASAAELFGVAPLHGRWFEPDGDPAAVLLSEGLWRRRFGADPAVIGREIRLGDGTFQVLGVMPSRFAWPNASTQLWAHREYPISHDDRGFNYVAAGRMTDGATVAALRAELQALIGTVVEAPGAPSGVSGMVEQGRLQATPVLLKDHVIGNLRATLWVLLGAVGVLLATAWANVANLFLVRAESRRREVAVRRALGAGRSAIVRFFFAEAGAIGILSGVLGLALAWSIVRAVVAFTPLHLPRADEIAVGPHGVVVTLLLAAVSGLLLTLLPLLRRDSDPATSLREGGRGATAGRAPLRFRAVLMAGQVALALTLVAGAGLLLRSWSYVRDIDPGFTAHDLLFVELALPDAYSTRDAQAAFFDGVVARVSSLPGVRSVGLTTCAPLDGYCWGESVTRDDEATQPDAPQPIVSMRRVSHDYFETMGLPLVAGRDFTAQDIAARSDGVVLGQETARRLFPDVDPLGRRVTLGDGDGADAQWFTVIGVAGDIATRSVLQSERDPLFYLPFRDSRDGRTVGLERATMVVNAGVDPDALGAAVRGIVHEADPAVAPSRIRTLEQVLAEDRATLSFATLLLVFAGGMGLALSALGVYAVFAYTIGRRTAEFGLRLALGARATDIARIVFRQAGLIMLVGLLAGAAAVLASTRLLDSLLFGVDPLDPVTLGTALLLLILVAALAVAVPTRRATRLLPVQALRVD